MKTQSESFDEKMGDHGFEIYMLSRKLLALAVLIESQSAEFEKLAELEGLGMALRDYSQALQKIRSSIDEMDVAAAVKRTRRPGRRFRR